MIDHQAIYNTHSNIVSIIGDKCLDIDGNIVAIDTTIVEIEKNRLIAEFEKIKYQQLRAREYPPITDYLDGMVKGDQAQIDAYVAACQAVKNKNPKP